MPITIKQLFVVCFAVLYLFNWEYLVGFDDCPMDEAAKHSNAIIDQIPDIVQGDRQDIYLLYTGDPPGNCLLAQRIYLNLVDKNIFIKNFYTDMQIINYAKENLSAAEEKEQVGKWIDNLFSEYDYIYVISSDNATDEVFIQLTGETALTTRLYKVDQASHSLQVTEERR